MKTLKPGSFGHRGLIGKKVVAKEANRVSAKCAIPDTYTSQSEPEPELGTISRKTIDSTDKLNGQNPLDIAVTNALELLRGQNFEN